MILNYPVVFKLSSSLLNYPVVLKTMVLSLLNYAIVHGSTEIQFKILCLLSRSTLEDWRAQQPKHCDDNEDSSLNVNNINISSQKFKQKLRTTVFKTTE